MVTVEHHAETIKSIDSAVVTVEHHVETIERIDSAVVTVEHHAETIKTIDLAVVTVEHHVETIKRIDSAVVTVEHHVETIKRIDSAVVTVEHHAETSEQRRAAGHLEQQQQELHGDGRSRCSQRRARRRAANAARGNPIPLTFAQILGVNSCDAKAVSIAQIVPGEEQDYTIDATNNPFLAGMPSGTQASENNPHNSPDTAGSTKNKGKTAKTSAMKQNPVDADITVVPNTTLTFDGVNGGANNDLNDPNRYTADGNAGWITTNSNGAENGISDLNAPINCLVGVFLDDNPPSSGSTPSTLDFSTPTSRDFTSLKPQLKQLFFIGDGRTSNGEPQQFQVPAGGDAPVHRHVGQLRVEQQRRPVLADDPPQRHGEAREVISSDGRPRANAGAA